MMVLRCMSCHDERDIDARGHGVSHGYCDVCGPLVLAQVEDQIARGPAATPPSNPPPSSHRSGGPRALTDDGIYPGQGRSVESYEASMRACAWCAGIGAVLVALCAVFG